MGLPLRIEGEPRPLAVLRGAEAVVAGLLVVGVLTLVVYQVVTRYVFGSPSPWSEELARFALIWLTFMGAAYVAARGSHITVEVGSRRLGTRGVAALQILSGLVTLAVCAVLLASAPEFLRTAGRTSSPAASIPMGWVYGAAVLGYALIGLHTVIGVVTAVRHPERIRDGHGAEAEVGQV